ncbi:hypothetical protein ACK6W1_22255, partial [Escherichia coli]
MSNLLSKKDSVFVSDLLREAKVNELDETLSTTRLNHLIDKGYERITLQLDLGGESPGGFAPIFPDTCYHLTHYWPAAADIPVASDNPVHYADA